MIRRIRVILIVMIIASMKAMGQAYIYHPFPESGAVWRIQGSSLCTIPPPYMVCNDEYQFETAGDTLVNGLKYIKLYSQGWFTDCISMPPNNYVCSSPAFSSGYWGAYRNDTVSKKVYVLQNGLPDLLAYDFSLNIGDTLKGTCGGNIIVNIDSILIGNTYRKRFLFENDSLSNMCVIEGIGGIVNMWTPFDGMCSPCVCLDYSYLQCFVENGVTLFPNSGSTCSLVGINEVQDNSTIIISPNPTSSTFTLTTNTPLSNPQIIIYNTLGETVYSEKTNTTSNTFSKQINLNAPSGVYIIKLTDSQNQYTTKLIIQ